MQQNLVDLIHKRCQDLNAVILSHFYQPPEIQDIADIVGDSLQLARDATKTSADVIVICGVSFMAESAKIMNPDKLILIPDATAGCPMADMITGAQLKEWKASRPGAQVVCYVNSSAEVKAESDICCTSSNAVEVVNSLPQDVPILFVPDKNLAHFVSLKTGREIEAWEGCCPIHHQVTVEQVLAQKALYPDALVLVHPECPPEVVALADEAISTGGMLKYVEQSLAREFIIGTEAGLLHQMYKRFPDREFHIVRKEFLCPDMKLGSLQKLYQVLETLEPPIEIPEEIRVRAYQSLERMLAIG
ncbi:MAG: quinolinate synthase NadA [Syntrophomonadaceae bacterium]|nr:quinolinate synthase NadA [Syntrophomonadaceae bacterium]